MINEDTPFPAVVKRCPGTQKMKAQAEMTWNSPERRWHNLSLDPTTGTQKQPFMIRAVGNEPGQEEMQRMSKINIIHMDKLIFLGGDGCPF